MGGHVNVITGDFIDYEMDCILPGPEGFPLERVYTSSDEEYHTFGVGWRINHDYSARYAMEVLSNHPYSEVPKTGNHFFIVTDGLGAKITYKGLHGDAACAGGYRIENSLFKKGMTNASGERISGKTNIQNNEAWIDLKKGSLRYGNGDVLFFKATDSKAYEATYLATIKKKLNRLKETYSFGESGIKSINFHGSSDTNLGSYRFIYTHIKHEKEILAETPVGPIHYFYRIHNNTPQEVYLLDKVVRPHLPAIDYEYEGSKKYNTSYIRKKNFPDKRYVEVDYYHGDSEKFKHYPVDRPYGIVKSILRPLEETERPIQQYTFYYHHEKGKDDSKSLFNGHTDVVDPLGFKRRYHYEKSRLTAIDMKYRKEEILWGDSENGYPEGYYIGAVIKDSSDAIQLKTLVEYDSFGNVVKESLEGNLRGCGTHDSYSKEMVYTQDGRNLLIEEKDYKKKIICQYLDETNLLAARFLTDLQKICKREFFFYDDNGFKIKEIVDDGSGEHFEDLRDVSERHIIEYRARASFPFGLSEETVYKAYDPSTGIEKQLKRVHSSYTIEGWLQQEDFFDADGRYVCSKKYRYNHLGKVIYKEDPTGAITEYVYDENSNKIEEIGPLPGYRKVFRYDYSNRLIKEKEILEKENLSLVKSYRYNRKSECIEETDISGNSTKYTYDPFGRKTSTESPVFFSEWGFRTLKTSTEYDCLNNPCLQIDARGNQTKIQCTVRGTPYLIEYPDNTAEKMVYNEDGTLKESYDKYGNKTLIVRDYLGRHLSKEVYSPSGDLLKHSTFEYNAFHLIKETDALGCKTYYEYDFAGRLIRKTRGTAIEEYSYDKLSRLYKTITWTDGNDAVVLIKRFDNNDRVIEETTELLSGFIQARVRYGYNALGEKIKEARQVHNDEEAVTHYVYNARGDLIETINPFGISTKIHYDYYVLDARGERGTRVISIDPKGVLTIIDKNALGLEKRGEKKNSLGETLQLWDYLYNEKGEKYKRIEVVYSEGKPMRHVISVWMHDALGRLSSITEGYSSPDEKTTRITYNNYGQREAIIKPSGLSNLFKYDTLGRMSRWYSSDHSFDYSYSYDPMDNLLKAGDALYGTATLKTYDLQGRLIDELQSNGLSVRYDYDKAGRVSRFTYPDNSSVAYEYEGSRLRFIKRISNANQETYHFTALEYDYLGRVRKGQLPLNAGEFEVSRDMMGRTTNVKSKWWNETITGYDLAGNLLTRTIQDQSGTLYESYAYDELNQLIEETGAASHKYRFDSLYNRIKEDESENAVNDLNQILEREDRSYRYDADGNLIEIQKPDKTLRFGYDAAGRMTSFTDGSTTAHYRYDETNRRIAKIINNSEITRYIYNGQCELGSFDNGGEIRILSGLGLGAEIGEAIAIEKGEVILTPIHDHNGNLMSLIDAKTGVSIYHARYSAFGMEEKAEGEKVSWGFSSKRKDSESGLIFFGRRYYDPESGRFVTKDPLGDRDGPNLYAYVSNNPLMFVDLWGLICERCGRDSPESTFAPMRWIERGVEFVGSCIETFSRHCLPPGPIQHVGEGIGRFLQGRDFSHKDNYAKPLYIGARYGYEMEGVSVGVLTGIDTEDPATINFANNFSDGLDGAAVGLQCHRSSGILNDLWNVVHLLFGMQTDATRAIAESIKNDFYQMKNAGVLKPLIVRGAHSRGGLELYVALKLLPPEIKSCIAVYTFGSAYLIPPDGLRGAINFVNPNDLIPKLASVYCRGNGANIVYTNYRTDGMFYNLEDHLLKTDGYQQAIIHACDDLLEKWKGLR